MKPKWYRLYFLFLLLIPAATAFVTNVSQNSSVFPAGGNKAKLTDLMEEGKDIFRYDTFGDESYWGGQLGLHKTIAGSANGGVGPGLSPVTALSLGLKVDVEALPQEVLDGLKNGTINLNDPAITLALLKLNAVVGVKGIFDGDKLSSIGITCSFCHSTVDSSFTQGIGKRLDGWANRDLNVGAIVSFAADLEPIAAYLGADTATVKKVLMSWGPGKYDAELNLDGKAFRPDGKPAATLIPAAFGLAGVNLHTYTGWGSIPYWNAFVAITQMHGHGNFYDPRLDDQNKFPLGAKNKLGHIQTDNDLVTGKLAALQAYQLSICAPKPPEGSFDASAAQSGEMIFTSKAKCASCHVPPLFSEPGWAIHKAEEIGIDDFQAMRSPAEGYRTTPLKGLWAHSKGGFYHDGRFATLADVVDHYDSQFNLGLSSQEKSDLVEYLKSLGDGEPMMASIGESTPLGTLKEYKLYNNYPNPFNPNTTFEYFLPQSGQVTLKVYDALGKEVTTLVRGQQQAGNHKVNFNAASLPSGVYIFTIQAGNFTQSRKMVLLK